MFAQLFGFLLFACQIILNGSHVINAEIETNSVTLPEGYVSFPDVHAAYKIYDIRVTWNEARDRCVEEKAHLAIADTVDKIVHINSLKSNEWGSDWLHVGIYNSNVTNEWVRVDSDVPVTSIPWATFFVPPYAGCTAIPLSENKLTDVHCSLSEEFYVCEIPI